MLRCSPVQLPFRFKIVDLKLLNQNWWELKFIPQGSDAGEDIVKKSILENEVKKVETLKAIKSKLDKLRPIVVKLMVLQIV